MVLSLGVILDGGCSSHQSWYTFFDRHSARSGRQIEAINHLTEQTTTAKKHERPAGPSAESKTLPRRLAVMPLTASGALRSGLCVERCCLGVSGRSPPQGFTAGL